ncbi:MAG TPA: BNR repeat-containing protein [Polyangiaceae bacterium]|nr:BNR repeat-containing protein [Polyangiaceae bacterium]
MRVAAIASLALVACSGDPPSGGAGHPLGSSLGSTSQATAATVTAGSAVGAGGAAVASNSSGYGASGHGAASGGGGTPDGSSATDGAAETSNTAATHGTTTAASASSAGGAPGATGSSAMTTGTGGMPPGEVVEVVDIAEVWSGHPVAFALYTRGDRQFVAFYDAERRMTVAARTLGEATWQTRTLPSTLGWDSHNYVTLALDETGHVHVAGNMHNVPLIYFRATTPLDVESLTQVSSMVGSNESNATYPEFFTGPAGNLIFAYRDGGSGNGNHIFNAYSAETRAWSRLLDTPLTDGQGQYNAYPVGPIQGPDGYWHLVWVWRDTPDASTNHDLSYARTVDLVNWEGAAGASVDLPITLATGDIVDAVPAGGGMINNNTKVGFDAQNRPIVAYHKYDSDGNTQLYNARFEDGVWVSHRTSSWDYRWDFGGGGTLVFEIEVEPVVAADDGTLTQRYYHAEYGGYGAFRLNPDTLEAEAEIEPPLPYPRELDTPESPTPDMVTRWQEDAGTSPEAGVVYLLRWETLPSNRDEPRDTIPPPTPLRLYGFATGE